MTDSKNVAADAEKRFESSGNGIPESGKYDQPSNSNGRDSRPVTMQGRIMDMIASSQEPLRVKHVVENFDYAGFETINRRSIYQTIARMAMAEQIKRLDEGVYSNLEFDDSQYELSVSLREKIMKILSDSQEETMTSKDIILSLGGDFSDKVFCKKVNSRLRAMTLAKEINCLERGVYSHPEFNDSQYRSKPTIDQIIIDMLQNLKKPMTFNDVVAEFDDAHLEGINVNSIRTRLVVLAHENRIKRLDNLGSGVYACLELENGDYETPVKLNRRIMAVLSDSGKSLKPKDVTKILNSEGLDEINPGSVRTILLRMSRKTQHIKRLETGAYSLAIDEEIINILRYSLKPMSYKDVYTILRAEGYKAGLGYTGSRLYKMFEEGLVSRPRIGLYSMLSTPKDE